MLLLSTHVSTKLCAQERTLAYVSNPDYYAKREKPIFNIALVYYGSEFGVDYLDRISKVLIERFFKATDQKIALNIKFKFVLPYLHQISSYPDYKQPYVTEIIRLQRLWYYDNVDSKIMNEVYNQIKKNEKHKSSLEEIDAVAIITGAQFDGLGYASGRIAVTENPREIAWNLIDGYTEIVSDYNVADELIHELGHTLFLDHTSNQCMKLDSLEEREKCCKESPSGNDVMSYCRGRSKVDDQNMHSFSECSLKIIQEKIVPSMINGGKWNISNRPKCP